MKRHFNFSSFSIYSDRARLKAFVFLTFMYISDKHISYIPDWVMVYDIANIYFGH